jgi:hypothetical protein
MEAGARARGASGKNGWSPLTAVTLGHQAGSGRKEDNSGYGNGHADGPEGRWEFETAHVSTSPFLERTLFSGSPYVPKSDTL